MFLIFFYLLIFLEKIIVYLIYVHVQTVDTRLIFPSPNKSLSKRLIWLLSGSVPPGGGSHRMHQQNPFDLLSFRQGSIVFVMPTIVTGTFRCWWWRQPWPSLCTLPYWSVFGILTACFFSLVAFTTAVRWWWALKIFPWRTLCGLAIA